METKIYKAETRDIKVEAAEWEGKRVYFKLNGGKDGQACWDIEKKAWIPVHKECGNRMLTWLEAAYSLRG